MRNVNILVNYTCALTVPTVIIRVCNVLCLGYRLDNQRNMVQFLAGMRDFSLPKNVQTSFAAPYSVGTATSLTLVRTNHILSARDPWCTSAMLPLLSMITGLTLSSWKPEKSVTSSRRTPEGSSPFHLSHMVLRFHY